MIDVSPDFFWRAESLETVLRDPSKDRGISKTILSRIPENAR
jgi:hypothetical protein